MTSNIYYNKVVSKFAAAKNLLKILSAASLSTLIKSITSFIIGKLGAIWLGPAGIALMGQLGNVVTILNTLGAGLLENGTTALIAKNKDDKEQIIKISTSILKISLITSLVVGLLVIVFAKYINNLVFVGSDYTTYIIMSGLFIFLSASSNIVASIVNGQQQFKQVILINIITNILVFIVTTISMYFYKLNGAFFSIIAAQPICFYLTFIFVKKRIKLKPIILKRSNVNFNSEERNSVAKFIIMGFFSTIIMPATSFIVRSIIISHQSIETAGFWESIVKIGYIYSSFVLIGISYYFFPHIATMDGYKEIKKQIRLFASTIVPFFILGCIPIYIFRENVTLLVFTKQFAPINDLYLIQLCGEVLKIVAGLYVMVLWSKNRLFDFIITQAIYSFFYIATTYYLVTDYGAKAGVIAFFVSSVIYLILLILLLERANKIILNKLE